MSLRSSTKSINPHVCCFRYVRQQIDMLNTQTRYCARMDAHVADTILHSSTCPLHLTGRIPTCTSPLLRLWDLLVRIGARRPLLLPLGFAAPFSAVIVLAVLVGVIVTVLWLVHTPSPSAGSRSAVVRLAIRVVRARAVRRLVTRLAGFAGRVVYAAYCSRMRQRLLLQQNPTALPWQAVAGRCMYVPLLLFLPMPSLSITSSAHWMWRRSSGSARKRRTPDGAERRRTGFGVVSCRVWLPVSREGVAVREGSDIV
jgi:hypothetical protein